MFLIRNLKLQKIYFTHFFSTVSKELTFTHLAFSEKTIKTSDITKQNQIIYLVEKANILNEVILVGNNNSLTIKEINRKS